MSSLQHAPPGGIHAILSVLSAAAELGSGPRASGDTSTWCTPAGDW
ncbi:hypothetical protein [Euzebya tangerina]|nr:hypothetical protein [Euzebya tangerina]